MSRGWRAEAKRYGAPVVFLAAVTIAVLLVRSGLNGDATTTASLPSVPTVATTRASTTKHAPTKRRSARYYTVQTGDTYGSIAAKFGTTVARLEELNPGISSNSLTVGQRIRVK
jgi:membrane-bound lytic murein transglycosylase D